MYVWLRQGVGGGTGEADAIPSATTYNCTDMLRDTRGTCSGNVNGVKSGLYLLTEAGASASPDKHMVFSTTEPGVNFGGRQ